MALKPRYMSFIIPSRWFAGGKGLDKFRADMLKDRRVMKLYDYPDASDCFPGVEIKGGVCYFVWNSEYDGLCEVHTIIGDEELPVTHRSLGEFDVFIRFNEAVSILNKVRSRNEKTLNSVVSSRKPFGLISSFSAYDQVDNPDKYKLYAKDGKTGFVNKTMVNSGSEIVPYHKVLTGKAGSVNGTIPNKITGTTLYAEPNSVCTESFLVANYFSSKDEAINFISYMSTRLFRFLLSLRTPTQNISKECFAFIPDLPMDQAWTDEKLYERYDITPAEQKFIESMIKEMN